MGDHAICRCHRCGGTWDMDYMPEACSCRDPDTSSEGCTIVYVQADDYEEAVRIAEARMGRHEKGWWNMTCFNGLSAVQQQQVVQDGVLPYPWIAEGDGCVLGAEVAVETQWDEFSGPRFYCVKCAVEFLATATPPVKR